MEKTQLTPEQIAVLTAYATVLRINTLKATTTAGSGHPTSALSTADLIAVLFFAFLHYDYTNPKHPNNDRFILSKGHAIPIVYAALKEHGVLTKQELITLRAFNSPLEGHPTPRFAYNEAATGSLGQGLAIGVGMARAAKQTNRIYKTYVMLGDGESAEGSVWEAAELGAFYNLNNLIGILDCNRLGQSQTTQYGHEVASYQKKWEAFGWRTLIIDGHNIEAIFDAFFKANQETQKPTMIIAKTIKGAGLPPSIADQPNFHGKAFSEFECTELIEYLTQKNPEYSVLLQKKDKPLFELSVPEISITQPKAPIKIPLSKEPHTELFALGKKMATRKAYGYGLVALGKESNEVFVLDADVKNSTYTEFFEKAFPERFTQCFIAEQAMASIATGMQLRGIIPFAATFGCFWTRAHDQLRMAGIGRNALRICGSHAGVSIGPDGPSQMALEDIGVFNAIPDSIIFYPSDAVSTYKIVELMANYHEGISYIKTTRAETPTLYPLHESFTVGGCKIIQQSPQDAVCVVAVGIALHEVLKAQRLLTQEAIAITIIDLYSIKPFDKKTVLECTRKATGKLLTVEDHYIQGGMGQIIAASLANESITINHLAVTKLSRSGTPEELLQDAGIDAAAIVAKVKELLS